MENLSHWRIHESFLTLTDRHKTEELAELRFDNDRLRATLVKICRLSFAGPDTSERREAIHKIAKESINWKEPAHEEDRQP